MTSSWFRLGHRFWYLFVASVYDSHSKEGSAVSRRALKVGVNVYASAIMALLGKRTGRVSPARSSWLLLALIQRGFHALLECAERAAAKCDPMGT